MAMRVCLALLLLATVALGDTVVDDFWAQPISAELTSTTIIDTVSAGECDAGNGGFTGQILGGCHVVSMRGLSSGSCTSTASAGDGVFRCANGPTCSGECTLQLDGTDTTSLRTLSLGEDLLARGSGFRIFARSNVVGSTFTIRVYTSQTQISRAVGVIPSDNTLTEFGFNFALDFSGSADFTNVGAIEIEVPPVDGAEVEFSGWQVISTFTSISGRVFEDCACDDIITSFDLPVAGVTVTLTGESTCRTTSATATTDVNGLYEFSGLTDCDYEISIPGSAGALCGGANNPVEVLLRRSSVSTVHFAIDSGCDVPGAISGAVFEDVGCDSLRQNEIGLAGVSVSLAGVGPCSATVLSTTTDFAGQFEFLDLEPCDYNVIIPSSTANLCPNSFSSITATVLAGQTTENVDFRARAPGVWVLDDLLANTDLAFIGDTLGVARTDSESACDALSGGVAGDIVGGCHVVTITGVGTNTCNPSGQVQDGVFRCNNPVNCGGRCRLLLDGLGIAEEIEFGLEENLLLRGDAVRVTARSTQPTTITVTVYTQTDTSFVSSVGTINVPGFGDDATFDLNFLRDFTGGADFSNVGAIALEVANTRNVETVVTHFSIINSVTADISGTIFHDCNCDNFKDADDAIVSDITVSLAGDPACPLSAESVVSDEFGRYNFASLPPCTYTITVAEPVCAEGLEAREVVIARDSVFNLNFGVNYLTITCPDEVAITCGDLQPPVAGSPRVCGTTDEATFLDVFTCDGTLDGSVTSILRTFSVGSESCQQEINVLPPELPGVFVDEFSQAGEVLRIVSPDAVITVTDVSISSTVIGGVREVVLQGQSGAACEPLAGAVPQLSLSAVPPCIADVTARYDGNASPGRDFDLNLDLTELGDAMLVRALSNSARSITIRIYSSASELSQVIVNALEGQETDFILPWNLFNGNADITQVRAIEMFFSTDGSEVAQLAIIEWKIVVPLSEVSISGKVFRDEDCDLLHEDGEIALPNIPVRAVSVCGGQDLVTVTDAEGKYSFGGFLTCDSVTITIDDPNVLVCAVEGNDAVRLVQTGGANVNDVNFSVGCAFDLGQVCGDRCNPMGDPLADGTFIEALASCGTGRCASTSGFIECQGGVETVVCPTDGMALEATDCGSGRCGSVGRIECRGGVEVDTCVPVRDGSIVDNCGSGEGPCPGQGLVLCVGGNESGQCRHFDYTLSTTSCGEGACRGTGELRCLASGQIQDTCEPVPNGNVVSTNQGLRLCQDGQESGLLLPCDLIECSDGNTCTVDTCNSDTLDCDHEFAGSCDAHGSAVKLDRVSANCDGDPTTTFTYLLRPYNDDLPSHFVLCMDPERFVSATDAVDVNTGSRVCSAPDEVAAEADATTGVQGARFDCNSGAVPRGQTLRFTVTVSGTFNVNDVNHDDLIAVRGGDTQSDFDYLRVLGPWDCDCTASMTAGVVAASSLTDTDNICTDYVNDLRCSQSHVLFISVLTPNQNAAFTLDEKRFELEAAELVTITRYHIQVDSADPVSDRNGRIVVETRFFPDTQRSGAEVAAQLADLLAGRDDRLRGTLLEGAFVLTPETGGTDDQETLVTTLVFTVSGGSQLCISGMVMLIAAIVSAISVFQ